MKNTNYLTNVISRSTQFTTKLLFSSFALFIFCGIAIAQTNVAKGKPARQSSTYAGGGAASRAVDGNTGGVFSNNSVTHTASDTESGTWWEVDLGRVYNISRIKIFNRTDCCQERLNNTIVKVSTNVFSRNTDGVIYGNIGTNAGSLHSLNSNQLGRYVRIYKIRPGFLSLAEVEVYGTPATASPANGRASRNLTGNWRGYFKDGTMSAYVWAISQNGSTFSIQGVGSFANLRSKGRFSGNRVFADDFKTQGTLSADGSEIIWTDGATWRRIPSAPTDLTTSGSTAPASVNLSSGIWNVYTANGNRVTSYKTITSRSSGKLFVHLGSDRMEARVQGDQIYVPKKNWSGTITDNGNRVVWTNGSIWTRPGVKPPANSKASVRSNTTASGTNRISTGNSAPDRARGSNPSVSVGTPLEQQCFSMVQNKVPWNTKGDNRWGPAVIKLLCRGTTNPTNTIACFNKNMPQIGWQQAVTSCTQTSLDASAKEMASSDKSKQLPEPITAYLDKQFRGWEVSPDSELCGEKQLFETGDFDGDGQNDYAVYFVVNNSTPNPRQLLYAFLNKGTYFQPFKISEDDEPMNFSFSSFAIVKKGETLQTGEGENDVVILNVDAITEYKCETDNSATYVFGNRKFSAMDLYSP